MKFSVMLTTAKPDHSTQGEILDATMGYALTAEKCGYDTAWLLEHHFTPYGICPSTLMMAGYVLGATSAINVGTAIVVAPFDHPVKIAENVALLDQLSRGRLKLGLGRGFFPRDFEVFGVDPARSHEALYECYDVCLRAWTQNTVSNDGPLHPFPEIAVYPRVYTKPHPPIWCAGQSSSTVEWAAKRAIPLLMPSTLDAEETTTRMELYNNTATDAGHDPDQIEHALICIGYVYDSRQEAQDVLVRDLEWWSDEGVRVGFTVDQLKNLPNYRFHYRAIEQAALQNEWNGEYMIRKAFEVNPVGTAEQCVEAIEELASISGAKEIVFAIEGAGKPTLINENIERLATEVMPKVSV